MRWRYVTIRIATAMFSFGSVLTVVLQNKSGLPQLLKPLTAHTLEIIVASGLCGAVVAMLNIPRVPLPSIEELARALASEIEKELRKEMRREVGYTDRPLRLQWTAADSEYFDDWRSLVQLAESGGPWPPPPQSWASNASDLAGTGDD